MRDRKTLTKLIAMAVMIVALPFVPIFLHDNPPGLTLIRDVCWGYVDAGENITVKGKILLILVLAMGPHDQILTVGDERYNMTVVWFEAPVEVGWTIIAHGVLNEYRALHHVSYVERVWLFP